MVVEEVQVVVEAALVEAALALAGGDPLAADDEEDVRGGAQLGGSRRQALGVACSGRSGR